MFERFTERARQVVVLAQDEARAILNNFGADAEKIRNETIRMISDPPDVA